MSGATTPFHQRPALALLKTALFGGKPLTVGEMHAGLYRPAPGVLDPVLIAARQEDPRFLTASLAVQDAVAWRRQQLISASAAAFDVLAQRAGISTILNPPMDYPLTSYVFFNHGRLDPLLIRQKLIDAADSGAVTFPRGTSDQPIIHWVIDNPWMFLEPCADSPDSAVLQERYGIAEKPPATPLTGFPLRAVLELLEMLGQGQHPRFVAAAWDVLGELATDEPPGGGEPWIIFPER